MTTLNGFAVTTFNGFAVADVDAAVERVGTAWADYQGANLFVTGATGFLGQWLLAVLLRANATRGLELQVTALTRAPKRFAARCPDLAGDPAVTLVQGDVRFFDFPKGRFTHLIHAATDTSAAADAQPLVLMDAIVDGTRRALTFAQFAGIRKVLFTSSGAVYGPQPAELERLAESHGGAPATTDRRAVYGQSKRLAEQMMTAYHTEFGLDTKIARCFAFVGPGMAVDGHFAIGNFIRDAVAGGPIRIGGDGTPIRSYLYAGDAAAWLLRILAAGEPGTAYNVGSDEGVTIAELAHRVNDALGGGAEVSIAGQPGTGLRNRYLPDVARARDGLGLAVWTGIEDGVRRTAEWLRAQQAAPVAVEDVGAQEGSHSGAKHHTFVIDIDGVIAALTPGNDYTLATPLQHTIDAINKLYDAGHRIILFTARGYVTGIDWTEVTAGQMQRWGVKYHELKLGKPAADYYVDDRLITVHELAKMAEQG